jgi:hypothetical protein
MMKLNQKNNDEAPTKMLKLHVQIAIYKMKRWELTQLSWFMRQIMK